METSLRFDSTERKLHLYGKENFVSDDNVVLTVAGSLCTTDGSVKGRVHLRKKIFPQFLTRLDVGALYSTDSDEVRYSLKAKKSVELSDDGLLSLDFKGGCSFCASRKPTKHDFTGKVELSRKVFNFTEDQDLKLKIGCNAADKVIYAQVRENNWTLNMDVNGRWGIYYDL